MEVTCSPPRLLNSHESFVLSFVPELFSQLSAANFQFFITLSEELDYLDGKHTVFGEVAEGFEVLEKFNEVICDESSRPYQDIRISHTIVLDDPFDDPKGLEVPGCSPELTKDQLQVGSS